MYKYQVVSGCAVWTRKPTTYPKAKESLERVRHDHMPHFKPDEFEIERVMVGLLGVRRYWRKSKGKWVTYPRCLKRDPSLTPYEHWSYDPSKA